MIVMKRVEPFVRLNFESLFKGVKPDYFKSFHIVDKGCEDGTIKYCKERIKDVVIHPLDFYIPKDKNGLPMTSGWQWDMAYSYDYVFRACGKSEWVVLTHPDLVYFDADKFFKGIENLIYDDLAIIAHGAWCIIRRRAYLEHSHLGLWPLFGTVLYEQSSGKYVIVGRRQVKEGDKFFTIEGIEMYELFLIELQQYGWDCYHLKRKKPDIVLCIDHMAQCTEHDAGPEHDLIKNNRKRAEKRLKALTEGKNNWHV